MNNEIWLSIEEVSALTEEIKETVRRKCKREEYVSTFTKNGRFKVYSILLSSLPLEYQNRYLQKDSKNEEQIIDISEETEEYALAPLWARKQADKYMLLINQTKNMRYKEILEFIKKWNLENPEQKVSYTRLYEAKKKYEEYGVAGLLSKKGQNKSKDFIINSEYFDYYKSLYLREGSPSASSCWRATLGYAIQKDNVSPSEFPSHRTFDRRLKSEIPEQVIYYARKGESAWNKKYAMYVQRNYSNIKAGSCWVSDHAQIDVAVSFNKNIYFPWVTVFRDVKTSKWLGWFLHIESPNSEHIFQAFYYGVTKFGIPEDVYLDNGKDYRCKDFAGGRNKIVKVNHFTERENSLINNLGISVHFALPYNAQTKPVERDFLKIKEYLSKGFVGYRGGKITERPEKLKKEIKQNKILEFSDFKTIFDDFIENILNKMPSNGKVLKGRCPDEVWSEEFAVKKIISKDALKLFCMRTSRAVKIGRNGVHDSQFDVNYWGEWMCCEKGRKVFIRRDVNAYQEAWVFDATTEEYLGKANIFQETSFLAKNNLEKAQLQKIMSAKKKEKKSIRNYVEALQSIAEKEKFERTKLTLKQDYTSNPSIVEISNTKMDKVVRKEQNSDTTELIAKLKPKRKLYLTEAEKRRDLARMGLLEEVV